MKMNQLVAITLGLMSTAAVAATSPSTTASESKTAMSSTTAPVSGAAFLAENKNKPGVVTLPDGLQYKIIKAGTGPKPGLENTVVVNYEGTLINGKKFDSSYDRNEPAVFKVSQVIHGWVEALQLMPVGSTWELYIPANLAYGEEGAPPVIGPNETLIFKVELLGIQR